MLIHHLVTGQKKGGLSPALQSALIAWWKLDGNSNDASGNGHNGTDTAITYSAGKINQGATFNGSTSVITVPDHNDFSFAGGSPDLPFSISLWVAGGDFSGFAGFISKGNYDFNNTNEWTLIYYANNLYLHCRDKTTTGVYLSATISGAGFPNFSGYKHVVVTYNGNGSYTGIKFYINSVLQITSDWTAGSYTGMVAGTKDVTIGRLGNNYSTDKQLDEVSIFNIALNQTQVDELYNSGTGKTI